jgi:drug/metabolite transporter (DMT)-like permease
MGVWIRMMDGSFGTWQQVYLRILGAAIIAMVVFRKSVNWTFMRQVKMGEWGVYVLRSIFAYVIGVGFVTIAVLNADLATVSFISSLPVLGVFAWVMFREKVVPATLPFIGLSIVGLALLTGIGIGGFELGLGVVAAIISLVGFDIGYMMSRYHPKEYTNSQNTTLMLLVGWVPLVVVSSALGERVVPEHVTPIAWFGLLMGSIMNVATLLLLNYTVNRLKGYVVGNLLLLEGVFALITGLVLYGEVPTAVSLVGAGLIIGSALAISFIDSRRDKVESAGLEPTG